MNREELKELVIEALGEHIPNITFGETKDGEIIIFTSLTEEEEGEELVEMEEIDPDFVDENLEQLDEEDDDE